jgi:hypothetical protein
LIGAQAIRSLADKAGHFSPGIIDGLLDRGPIAPPHVTPVEQGKFLGGRLLRLPSPALRPLSARSRMGGQLHSQVPFWRDVNYQKRGGQPDQETRTPTEGAHDGSAEGRADGHGLTARDALRLLVGCMLTVLDEAPSDEERQQSLDNCVNLVKTYWVDLKH